jgi:hypothetical protein
MGWLIALGAVVIVCGAPFAWRTFARWFLGQDAGR